MMMIVYGYNPITGEYAGETNADESPLEPGVYLHPAHTTEIAPPAVGEREAAVWDGQVWKIVADNRGQRGYIDGVETEIKALGSLPTGWSEIPTEPESM